MEILFEVPNCHQVIDLAQVLSEGRQADVVAAGEILSDRANQARR